MPKVLVDMDTCIHSGMCTTLAAEVFTMDENARLVISKAQPGDVAEIERVKNAIACCPVEAISMEDD